MKKFNLSSEKNCVIEDLFLIQPETFHDYRGENFEGYHEESYGKIFSASERWRNGNNKFIVDSFSKSSKNVLRGFHGDSHTWKLVQCLRGSFYFVVIDLRMDSKTYGFHQTFTLNDKNKYQVLVPSGCVNAHLCLSDECLFHYKLTHEYVSQDKQIHVKWNDSKYNIYWPVEKPILSQRDS